MSYRGREDNSGGLSAECRGWELRDREGEKIGKVDEVFVDDNDRPEYLGVKMGLLGSKLTLLPADIVQANGEARTIEVSASRDRVKDAPSLGSNEEITTDRERGIREHFGLDSGSSESAQQDQDGDASDTSSPGYRRDSDEDQETHASNQDTVSDNERQTEENDETQEREPWTDSRDSSTESSDDSSAESARAAAGGTAAGYGGRDREESRETGGERQGRGGGSDTRGGSQETMRVSVWHEKARAEKVLGDDGSEEVRIRKQWVEEEEIVDVEDRRQG